MISEDVYRRVVETAERFGSGNPQQLKLLCSQFAAAHAEEVVAGLFLVFSRSDPTSSTFQHQELAGRILAQLNPRVAVHLGQCLREVLPAYNPSIEQVPQYLEAHCGRPAVLEELRHIEAEQPDTRTAASARTMQWGLKDK